MLRRPSRCIPRRRTTCYIVSDNRAVEYVYTNWKPAIERVALGRFRSHGDGVAALLKKGKRMAKRPSAVGPEGLQMPAHATPGKWITLYPTLSSYLCDPTWEDGKLRQPARIFVTPVKGEWEFTLKEPNLGVLLTIITELPDQGFEMLEAALNSPAPPWRPDQWAKKQSRK